MFELEALLPELSNDNKSPVLPALAELDLSKLDSLELLTGPSAAKACSCFCTRER